MRKQLLKLLNGVPKEDYEQTRAIAMRLVDIAQQQDRQATALENRLLKLVKKVNDAEPTD